MKNDTYICCTCLYLMAALYIFKGCEAEGSTFMELRKAAIEGGSYYGVNHDSYILLDNETERLQHTTDMIMNIDLACTYVNEVCIFWDNTIASKASESQYREVAWEYRLGMSIGKHLELGTKHISIHELDRKSNNLLRYPVENIMFLQLKFIDSPRRIGE